MLQNADIGREHLGEAQTEGVGEACSQIRPAKFLCAVDLAVEGIALPVCWDVLSFFKTHVAIAKDSVLSASSGSALRFGDDSNLALVVVLVVTKLIVEFLLLVFGHHLPSWIVRDLDTSYKNVIYFKVRDVTLLDLTQLLLEMGDRPLSQVLPDFPELEGEALLLGQQIDPLLLEPVRLGDAELVAAAEVVGADGGQALEEAVFVEEQKLGTQERGRADVLVVLLEDGAVSPGHMAQQEQQPVVVRQLAQLHQREEARQAGAVLVYRPGGHSGLKERDQLGLGRRVRAGELHDAVLDGRAVVRAQPDAVQEVSGDEASAVAWEEPAVPGHAVVVLALGADHLAHLRLPHLSSLLTLNLINRGHR